MQIKMSITFGYFWFYPDIIVHIWPEFLKAFVAILLNLMLLRAERAEKGKQKHNSLLYLIENQLTSLLLQIMNPIMITIAPNIKIINREICGD